MSAAKPIAFALVGYAFRLRAHALRRTSRLTTYGRNISQILTAPATAKIAVRAKSGDAREVSIDKIKIDYYQLQLDMATAK